MIKTDLIYFMQYIIAYFLLLTCLLYYVPVCIMLMQQFIIIRFFFFKHDLKRVHLINAIYSCLLLINLGMKCKYSYQVLCSSLCFPWYLIDISLFFFVKWICSMLFSLNRSVIF